MLTSASSENFDTRPRIRSLTRGWVTPQRCAASAWVHCSALMIAEIASINSARACRLVASVGVSDRACQTLSNVRALSFRMGRLLWNLRIALDVAQRRVLGRLVERVQDIDAIAAPCRSRDTCRPRPTP